MEHGGLSLASVTLKVFYCVQEVESGFVSMPTGLSILPCGRGVPLHDANSEKVSFGTSPDMADFSHLTRKHLSFSTLAFSFCQLLNKSLSLHDVYL